MQSKLEAYLCGLSGKQVAVIGIGVSNTPLIELLLEAGVSVTACDKNARESFGGRIEALEARGARVRLGADYLEDLTGFDVIFRTPGMRPDLPQLRRAVEAGAVLTSEMEVFFQVCPCRTIAVTGSDGKTTTTTIINGLLRAAGHRTFLGGNIGRPLLSDVPRMEPEDIAVLELSSFQLMTMDRSPDIAVVTNLAPNHLDIHTSMEEYVQAKENIYLHQGPQGRLVLNYDNEITRSFAPKARGEVTFFSRLGRDEAAVALREEVICRNGGKVLPVQDILLPGVHNVENYMAAIAAVEGLVPDQVIRDYARTFGGVEHRIELVRELDGVRWFNDSIGTSPTRTMACLDSFDQKLILIAGGYDKGVPFTQLGVEMVQKVKTLILCGATAKAIREAVEQAPGYRDSGMELLEVQDLASAVAAAQAAASQGDIVVLSPACAAFDQFKNFMERGKVFKELVNAL